MLWLHKGSGALAAGDLWRLLADAVVDCAGLALVILAFVVEGVGLLARQVHRYGVARFDGLAHQRLRVHLVDFRRWRDQLS